MTQEIQDKINLIKGPFQDVIDAADAIAPLVDAEVALKEEAAFKRGQDSMVIPSGGEYSQADMDKLAEVVRGENDEEVAKLTAVVGEKDVQLSEKDAKIAELEAMLEPVKSENVVLRAAIQAEIEDSKVDTARLEQAVAPVQFR